MDAKEAASVPLALEAPSLEISRTLPLLLYIGARKERHFSAVNLSGPGGGGETFLHSKKKATLIALKRKKKLPGLGDHLALGRKAEAKLARKKFGEAEQLRSSEPASLAAALCLTLEKGRGHGARIQ